jgi:hypothetical protein
MSAGRGRKVHAALTISCALVEVFGDGEVIEQWQLAVSALWDPPQLVELRGQPPCVPAPWPPIGALGMPQCNPGLIPAIYDNSAIYGNLNGGLIYSDAHNGKDAIVLYESRDPRRPERGTGSQATLEPVLGVRAVARCGQPLDDCGAMTHPGGTRPRDRHWATGELARRTSASPSRS